MIRSFIDSKDKILSADQSRILNYATLIRHTIKKYWVNLKKDFS